MPNAFISYQLIWKHAYLLGAFNCLSVYVLGLLTQICHCGKLTACIFSRLWGATRVASLLPEWLNRLMNSTVSLRVIVTSEGMRYAICHSQGSTLPALTPERSQNALGTERETAFVARAVFTVVAMTVNCDAVMDVAHSISTPSRPYLEAL